MPFAIARDLCVHYRLDGPADAPVVMFGNSLGTDLRVWDAQVDTALAGYRVLRYDVRGHGLTEVGARTDVDMELLAADAVALLDELGIASVTYVGLSIGGLIGQTLAVHSPARVNGLVLCATAAKIGTPQTWSERIELVEREGVAALVAGTLQRWFTPATHAARPELLRGAATMLQRTPAAGYIAACGALRDADRGAANAAIRVPTLVIAGAEDPVTTPAMCADLRDTIAGAALTTIDGAAHIVPAEAPAAFNAALESFLQRTIAAQPA